MPVKIDINADVVTIISAVASMTYAVIAALSLWLLSRQIRDARRFGAAPAFYALLKELEDHMAAIRHLGDRGIEEPECRETVTRCLEFFERIEHLRSAGMVPADALRRAFGQVLQAYLADPRFAAIIGQNPHYHEEVVSLARHIGLRR